jgi:hypothetical protein
VRGGFGQHGRWGHLFPPCLPGAEAGSEVGPEAGHALKEAMDTLVEVSSAWMDTFLAGVVW